MFLLSLALQTPGKNSTNIRLSHPVSLSIWVLNYCCKTMNRPNVKRQHERQIGSIVYMVTLPCCLEIDPPIFKWQGSVTMYFNGDTAADA